jgi:hypothetical protein
MAKKSVALRVEANPDNRHKPKLDGFAKSRKLKTCQLWANAIN